MTETSTHTHKYLIILCMLNLTFMLCTGVLTHRFVEINHYWFTQGGTLIIPLWFITADLIAEIYGYTISKQLIWSGFICQLIFAYACNIIINLPYPNFWHDAPSYKIVLGSLTHTTISALLSYLIAGFLNIYFINKWKIMLKGKYFWIRSIGASAISEALFTFMAVFLIQFGKLPLDSMLKIAVVSYSLKLFYSIIFATPVNMIANYLKRVEKVEPYDYSLKFNPFKVS